MFSGMINHMGILQIIRQKTKGVLFRVHSRFSNLILGESIAIDGVCLTVTAIDGPVFECELSPETLNKTIAKKYQVGQSLNLERAMCLGDRMGGHWVTGHVDKTIIIESKTQQDSFIAFNFSGFSREESVFLISKGSVTINGVSLTINSVDDHCFSVMIIPHTLKQTNLAKLKPNDPVNVEWDYLAKIVVKQQNIMRTPLLSE